MAVGGTIAVMDSDNVIIRLATPEDEGAWRHMWAGYCTFYDVEVPDATTRTTWARILDTNAAVASLIAVDGAGETIGFANYVLHPHTWSAKTLCYLEDLYVRPEARGRRVAQRLIDHLIMLGRAHDWGRVYWHTNQANEAARRVYDRFTSADPYVRYTISL